MPPKYTMSDSESEADGEVLHTPSDQTLEKGLRDQVATIFKSGNMEELTVKRVRLAAEDTLGLTAGYFKLTGDWKARSENIIKDEVEIQDQAIQNPQSQASEMPISPLNPKPIALAKRANPETAPKPRKRQKTRTPVSDKEDELSAPSSDESDVVTKPRNRSKAPKQRLPAKKASVRKPEKDVSNASDFSDKDDVTKPNKPSKAPVKKISQAKNPSVSRPTNVISDTSDVPDNSSDAAKKARGAKDDSESEMSVVLDEEPRPKAPRKRQKSAGGTATKTKKASKGKDEDISPDQAEIKRLQGWLIKCGIRKLWGKELAPYDTPRAKIKHLKGMLEDAGMTGRPSQEKANQIREERELKADLEQIQQGAKQWGAKSDEENDEDAKPRRRLARGRQSLAFLESEGEETD
ncbi:Transcriptional regulator, putative [Penicillium digitatum PHI26]|uniref:Transcriptional regulator, putative n=2 Tax=Penicillium digitatum TaxID=36651 RepID=K9GDF2_PEND2|nr:Transcriptional regulator, putative [Penicillium digitatum Pd1]EKV19217.1 Transcriptional regulator, putative [Penicillium digitatum PHI26]EKV21177.1 Transcriptional regulator, putative [Penicillium digitatum Pd1]